MQELWHNLAATSVLCASQVDGAFVNGGTWLTGSYEDACSANRACASSIQCAGRGNGTPVFLCALSILWTKERVLSAPVVVRQWEDVDRLKSEWS